ncbi:MAG: hypothetical protein LUO93_02320 [Methanomicrobiales archaeon]|nr:hypothetical protein [Methanomicrobiales archaeon]
MSGKELVVPCTRKLRTLSDQIELTSNINLPKDAVIDALVLKVALTTSNMSGQTLSVPGCSLSKRSRSCG